MGTVGDNLPDKHETRIFGRGSNGQISPAFLKKTSVEPNFLWHLMVFAGLTRPWPEDPTTIGPTDRGNSLEGPTETQQFQSPRLA